ncbi:energy-coupling factor transporter transmembrane protein EcfT [Methanoplanus sp. FWC-SCC4]|uniref:Energy-coupling factor transporter transmembrane protein EcfT n=1 Tax=Methanochimaera problematica TaxID=2609417 RepID=A0AA97FBQ6_9EURY|nr:energy-coupling factor transporter transmembrane component T [Methanoplanus sp. FWC-SCC4]WOF15318.1 energy-coupling factor transporter transmembrane protein EcfT [Methanoplanus sp. FWC-SCC4]
MFFKKPGEKNKKMKKGICYIQKDSPVHRLDPRTKLLILILLSVSVLIDANLLRTLLLFGVVLFAAYISGLFSKWAGALRYILPFMIFIVVIDAFFCSFHSGTEFFSADFWIFHPRVTEGSVNFAASMGVRLLAIGGFSFLFIMTTSYSDFVKSLQAMKIPRMLSFSLGFALKSITSLSGDLHAIMDAQRSRGLEFDRDSIIKNSDKMFSLFVPMTVSVMNRSSNVCDAMQCRGYGSCREPTVHNPPVYGKNDFIAVFFVLIYIIFIHFFL